MVELRERPSCKARSLAAASPAPRVGAGSTRAPTMCDEAVRVCRLLSHQYLAQVPRADPRKILHRHTPASGCIDGGPPTSRPARAVVPRWAASPRPRLPALAMLATAAALGPPLRPARTASRHVPPPLRSAARGVPIATVSRRLPSCLWSPPTSRPRAPDIVPSAAGGLIRSRWPSAAEVWRGRPCRYLGGLLAARYPFPAPIRSWSRPAARSASPSRFTRPTARRASPAVAPAVEARALRLVRPTRSPA